MSLELLLNIFEESGYIRKVDKLPYELLSAHPIARGAFGKVYKALNPSTGKLVAVKQIDTKLLSNKNDEELEDVFMDLLTEITAIKKLSLQCSDYVIEFVDALWDKRDKLLYIVTDWHRGMTANDWVMKADPSEKDLEKAIYDMLKGLSCLHENGAVHRKIKPSNIMIDPKTLHIHYIDFGLACLKGVCTEAATTGPFRSAQEYSKQVDQEKKLDLWALGVTIYAMLLGSETSLHMYMSKERFHKDIINKYHKIGKVLHILLQEDPNKRDLNKAKKALGA